MEEFPFEIPQNWAWCRLGEVAQSNIGLTYKPTDISENGVPVLRSNNIQNDKLFLEDLVRVSCQIQDKNYINNGDILICARNGSRNLLGKSTIINNLQEPMVFGAFMAICRSDYNDWIFQVLRTNYFQRYLDNSNSTTINQITQSMLLNFPFPLPPLSEQRRIVSKIEEIFALIDELEINKTDLQTLIKQTKTKVLDLAIRGKLLSEELSRIEDKSSLPSEGLGEAFWGEATSDNGHNVNEELPKGWKTYFLKDISTSISARNYQILQSSIKEKGKIPVISQSSNYIEGYSNELDKVLKVEDFVIIFGDHTRNVKFIDFDFIVGADGVKIIKPNHPNKYIYYLLLYVSEKIENRGYSRHFQFIEKYPLNIPPLEEQTRIVQKIEQIFSELEKIETIINH